MNRAHNVLCARFCKAGLVNRYNISFLRLKLACGEALWRTRLNAQKAFGGQTEDKICTIPTFCCVKITKETELNFILDQQVTLRKEFSNTNQKELKLQKVLI